MSRPTTWYAVYFDGEVIPTALFLEETKAKAYADVRPGKSKVIAVAATQGLHGPDKLWVSAYAPWNPWA